MGNDKKTIERKGRESMTMEREKGFTLIELIVVIVILAIIALVSVPAYVDITSDAEESAVKGQLGTIRSALAMSYASTAVSTGSAAYPATITANMFAEGTIPDDPIFEVNAVIVDTDDPVDDFDNTGGWIYNATTGEVRCNATGYTTL